MRGPRFRRGAEITATVYAGLASCAGDHLVHLLPRMACDDMASAVGVGSAVYVVTDGVGRAVYVGSVHRPADRRGLVRRIREHLRDPEKADQWDGLWVIPLSGSATRSDVRRLEAIVGDFVSPRMTKRLPAIGPRLAQVLR